MKNYKLYLFVLCSLVLLSGCASSKPTQHTPVKSVSGCLINSQQAPAWCCNEEISQSIISSSGNAKDEKSVAKLTYKNFSTKIENYLFELLDDSKYKNLTIQDKKALILATSLQLQSSYEVWKPVTSQRVYVLYSIEKKSIDAQLQKERVRYKTTRVYQECFKTASTKLQTSCKKKMNAFLRGTTLSQKRNIIIEVHTDKAGSSKNNLKISKIRAYNAAASLYHKEYKFSKVYFNGFGESEPLVDTETSEANFKNRRLVITLKDKNAKVDSTKFKRFKHLKRKTVARTQKKKHTEKNRSRDIPKKESLIKYTGQADTGWIYFGNRSLKEKFTISCAEDKPRKVKRKAISRSEKSEFMPGYYSKRVKAKFNNNTLELYPLYIYENGYLPESNPMLSIYKDSSQIKRVNTTINTYRGTKGILYRVFVNGKKSVKCMDLVIPYEKEDISYGRVYTQKGSKVSSYKLTY